MFIPSQSGLSKFVFKTLSLSTRYSWSCLPWLPQQRSSICFIFTTSVFKPYKFTNPNTVFFAFTSCKRMKLRTLLSHKLNFYSQSDYFPSVSLTLHSCSINRTSLLLFPPHHFLLLIVYSTVGSAWHIKWPILPNTAPKECHNFHSDAELLLWLKISLFK